MALQPPSSIRARGVVESFQVIGITGVENTRFDPVTQEVRWRKYLEHPGFNPQKSRILEGLCKMDINIYFYDQLIYVSLVQPAGLEDINGLFVNNVFDETIIHGTSEGKFIDKRINDGNSFTIEMFEKLLKD